MIWQITCFANESDKSSESTLVPVVNERVKQNAISKHGLSAIFKMRLHTWKDDSAITVFVLADQDPLHKAFCKEVLNVFPHQMRRTWDRLVFSGAGQAPIELDNKEEMIRMLTATPGAIGYLRSSDIKQGIKALRIQSGRNQ
nr:hypothetical protein [Methylomarinum sp. Ch1-1]MDP4519967.1 hypothetical protein [Methylomarinum sp. Ch1-1]